MLDKKCITVFDVLKSMATENNYKVVTIEELQVNLKGFSSSSIKQCIDTLTREGYISIKFNEDNTYCYSIVKPTSKNFKTEKTANNKLLYLFVALASFIGSFLAFLLFVIIF